MYGLGFKGLKVSISLVVHFLGSWIEACRVSGSFMEPPPTGLSDKEVLFVSVGFRVSGLGFRVSGSPVTKPKVHSP